MNNHNEQSKPETNKGPAAKAIDKVVNAITAVISKALGRKTGSPVDKDGQNTPEQK